MIGIFKTIQNDIDDFYKQSLSRYHVNKHYIEKKYIDTKRLLNIELENYKHRKNKYDTEIYKDEDLLKKKLENELKNISDNFKNNILKNILTISEQLNETKQLESILKHLTEMRKIGNFAIYGGKIVYI